MFVSGGVHDVGAQEHWRSLKTDKFLQVLGTQGSILALGDASTVSQVCPSPFNHLCCKDMVYP